MSRTRLESLRQIVGRHGLRRRFQQKGGRDLASIVAACRSRGMSMFFDDGGRASKEMGWWITAEDSFGEHLLWCAGNSLQVISKLCALCQAPSTTHRSRAGN